MNADGTNVLRLTNDPKVDWPDSFSPDGKHISFTSYRDGLGEIFKMNSDGTAEKRLTNEAYAIDTGSAWSPDGQRIVFCRVENNDADVYSMAPDGTGLTNLTNDPLWH